MPEQRRPGAPGSAADPEWEAVLAQLLAEEEQDKELYRCDEEEEDARIEGARFCGCSQAADGWDGCSEEEEDGHAAVQGVAGTQKVDESLELRDERACTTGGGFGMPQAALTSVGYHSCTGIEEGFNNHNKGIEGDCASPVPIVTNQPSPLFVDPILRGPDSKAAPSRTRKAPAAATAPAPKKAKGKGKRGKRPTCRVPVPERRFDAHLPGHFQYPHDFHLALELYGAWRSGKTFDDMSREHEILISMLRHVLPRPAVLGGLSRSGLPWEAGYLEHFSLASDPESAASRKQVLLEEGWPRGEMPSKSELREHMLACAALRYKVGLVYHGNAAETGEYLYDPNYTPTRDIEQVVHTLSAMFKPTSVEPELRQGL